MDQRRHQSGCSYDVVAAYYPWVPTAVDAMASLSVRTRALLLAQSLRQVYRFLKALMKPWTGSLYQTKIRYTPPQFEQFPIYLSELNAMMPPILVWYRQHGGQLIPWLVVQSNLQGLTHAYEKSMNSGATFSTVGVNANSPVVWDVYIATLPAWRTTLLDVPIQM